MIIMKWMVTTNLEINIFGVPDTMSFTNQFVLDIKENVIILYQTMTVTGRLFQDCVDNIERDGNSIDN